jgi:integrase
MPKPVVTKPRTFPKLGRGEGSWGWDPKRRKVTLRFLVGGKQKIVRKDNPAECITERDKVRAAAEADAEAEAGLLRGNATVAQLLQDWFDYHAGSREVSTRKTYRRSMGIIARHPIAHQLARDVTMGDIERFYLWMVDHEDLGQGQLKMTKGHLNLAYLHGIRHGYAVINPVPGSVFPGHTRKPKDPKFLLEDQFNAMRQYLRDNHSTACAALLVFLLTGLRMGELLTLCWEDVDVDMHVRRQLKTDSSERKIQLTSDLIVTLQRERQDQRTRRMAAARWRDSDLVFTRPDGKPLTEGQVRYALEKVCDELGFDRISAHKLRHTNGSMLLDRGATLADVAKHLGHKDLQMVTRVYAHSVKAEVPVAALLAEIV